MYMRLIGYPGDKISILTTYNGQKTLIRDILRKRCVSNPLIGNPKKITTVDKVIRSIYNKNNIYSQP